MPQDRSSVLAEAFRIASLAPDHPASLALRHLAQELSVHPETHEASRFIELALLCERALADFQAQSRS